MRVARCVQQVAQKLNAFRMRHCALVVQHKLRNFAAQVAVSKWAEFREFSQGCQWERCVLC